jgi:hypothetical protein
MSENKKPWKSKILESLGVKSAAIQTAGPSGRACGLALAAAFSAAIGGVSMDSHAGERIQKESSSTAASNTAYSVIGIEQGDGILIRTGKVAATLGQIVMSPQTEVLSLGAQAAIGSVAGAQTKSTSKGIHAAELVGTAAGVVFAAPVFGTLMVISQARSTYTFIQEEQEKAVKVKMEEVGDRVASVREQFTQEMRLEDRADRQAWPDARKEIDQTRMYDLAVESAKYGGQFSEDVQIRYDIEQKIEASGGKTEPWFSKFAAVKEQLAVAREQDDNDMLATTQDSANEKVNGTFIEKIDMAAALGGSGLKTSNKNFAIYSKEATKKNDPTLGM